jgi:hypothetical protein
MKLTVDTPTLMKLVAAVMAGIAFLFIWLMPEPISQDLYGWMYHGHLMAEMLTGGETFSYTLTRLPVPNAAIPMILGALNLVFDPVIAGQLVLSGLIALYGYLLWLLVCGHDRAHERWLLLGFFSLYAVNYFIMMGFLSYFAAQTLMLIVIVRLDQGHGDSIPTLALWSLVLYFTHGFVFLLWGVFLAIHQLNQYRWRGVTRLAAMFMLPAVLAIIYYTGSDSTDSFELDPVSHSSWVVYLIQRIYRHFSVFFRIFPFKAGAESLAWLYVSLNILLVAASSTLIIAALISGVRRYGKMERNRRIILQALIVMGLLVLLTPRSFMLFLGPHGRLAWLMLFLAVMLLKGRLVTGVYRVAVPLTMIIAIAMILYQATYLLPVSRQLSSLDREVRSLIDSPAPDWMDDFSINAADESLLPREGFDSTRIEGMLAIFPTANQYQSIAMKAGVYAPTFQTALLVDGRAHSAGRWQGTVYVAPDWSGDQLFIFGELSNREFLKQRLSTRYQFVTSGELFTLLERRRVASDSLEMGEE